MRNNISTMLIYLCIYSVRVIHLTWRTARLSFKASFSILDEFQRMRRPKLFGILFTKLIHILVRIETRAEIRVQDANTTQIPEPTGMHRFRPSLPLSRVMVGLNYFIAERQLPFRQDLATQIPHQLWLMLRFRLMGPDRAWN